MKKYLTPGLRFGRLVIQMFTGERILKDLYQCLCDCGTEVEVTGYRLASRTKPTRSCGCLRRDSGIQAGKANATHGLSHTYLYDIWRQILRRCFNPKDPSYSNYGGRGVSLYPPWRDFLRFNQYVLSRLGHRPTNKHSIDRIRNNSDYKPGNLRWATRSEQNFNQRRNRFVLFQGKKVLIAKLAEQHNIPYSTLYSRIERGLTSEKAVTYRKYSHAKN